MKHSRKEKISRMLSPENYIRQRARLLPVYECLVNSDWKNDRIANVIVTRQHSNGNFTVGLYLADLFCQGIKDTHWYFNISPSDYKNFREELSEHQSMETIPYVIAHNIIFAAHEYAMECGLDSHIGFTGTTQFILEEDSENIELIDIECGEDGMPVFMSSPGQSQAQVMRILARLEKGVGPGNYKVVYSPSDYPGNSDDDIIDDGSNNTDYDENVV
jgi:hypothetical protein